MKIIWQHASRDPRFEENHFLFGLPQREGQICVDALNANARFPDHYELVGDDYRLYRPREHSHEYFVALGRIWQAWFDARSGKGEPLSMLERDKLIAELQAKGMKAAPTPKKPVVKRPMATLEELGL